MCENFAAKGIQDHGGFAEYVVLYACPTLSGEIALSYIDPKPQREMLQDQHIERRRGDTPRTRILCCSWT